LKAREFAKARQRRLKTLGKQVRRFGEGYRKHAPLDPEIFEKGIHAKRSQR
jgi:hypothetical protein